MIAPKFSEFSNKYTNVTFVHVDVDEVNHPDVAGVSGVPHFKFFKDGKLVTEFSGIYPFPFFSTLPTSPFSVFFSSFVLETLLFVHN